MRLLFDLGHPAHFFYFKDLFRTLNKENIYFDVYARDKDVLHGLLRNSDVKFVSREFGGKSILLRIRFLIYFTFRLYKHIKKAKITHVVSFASPYISLAGWLAGKRVTVFDDTEHAKYERLIYAFCSDTIITPESFSLNLGSKHKTFNSHMELLYLHPDVFVKDNSVLSRYDLLKGKDKYFIIRLVSWQALHDVGAHGLNEELLDSIFQLLSTQGQVWFSSEGKLPSRFRTNELSIEPEDFHSILAFSSGYIGEGSTTAMECALLGVPNIYVNSLEVGYYNSMAKLGLGLQLQSLEDVYAELQGHYFRDITEFKRLNKAFISSMSNPNLAISNIILNE